MITPIIHRLLTRNDLFRLVGEIMRVDTAEGRLAQQALEAGKVDAVLDSEAALDAVLGLGGAPAPLPLALLWYVPLRAALCERGEPDIELADYAATLPVAFAASRTTRAYTRGQNGIATWWQSIASLPDGTAVQAERTADMAALALWWAGCFPEWVARRGGGAGMIRAYVIFAAQAYLLASRVFGRLAPAAAALCARAAERADVLQAALADVRRHYLGRDAHTPQGRLDRFLSRLKLRES